MKNTIYYNPAINIVQSEYEFKMMFVVMEENGIELIDKFSSPYRGTQLNQRCIELEYRYIVNNQQNSIIVHKLNW